MKSPSEYLPHCHPRQHNFFVAAGRRRAVLDLARGEVAAVSEERGNVLELLGPGHREVTGRVREPEDDVRDGLACGVAAVRSVDERRAF